MTIRLAFIAWSWVFLFALLPVTTLDFPFQQCSLHKIWGRYPFVKPFILCLSTSIVQVHVLHFFCRFFFFSFSPAGVGAALHCKQEATGRGTLHFVQDGYFLIHTVYLP